MAVTRARKSSLRSSAKYSKATAGAPGYPWLPDGQYSFLSGSGWTSAPDPSAWACTRTADGTPLIIRANTSPGASNGSSDGGFTWATYAPNIGYTSYPGAFNGAFIGGGNYMTSSAAYSNDFRNGWTYLYGLYNINASFGAGNGGFTSKDIPVFVIPYTTGGTHYITYRAEALGSYGISTHVWNNGIAINTAGGNGYQSKVAVNGDRIVYIGYNNTAISAAALFIKTAALNADTGAPGTWSTPTGPFTPTSTMTSLQVIGGKFVVTTADNKIYFSTTGDLWFVGTSPYAGTSALYLSPPIDGKIMALPGTLAATAPQAVYTSSDGTTWTTEESLGGYGTSPSLTMFTGTTGLKSVMMSSTGPGSVTYANANRIVN